MTDQCKGNCLDCPCTTDADKSKVAEKNQHILQGIGAELLDSIKGELDAGLCPRMVVKVAAWRLGMTITLMQKIEGASDNKKVDVDWNAVMLQCQAEAAAGSRFIHQEEGTQCQSNPTLN